MTRTTQERLQHMEMALARELLAGVACSQLETQIRYDGPELLVRLADDNPCSYAGSALLAQRLADALLMPVRVEGGALGVSASYNPPPTAAELAEAQAHAEAGGEDEGIIITGAWLSATIGGDDDGRLRQALRDRAALEERRKLWGL